MRSLPCLAVVVCCVLCPVVARAVEAPPVIVSYEMLQKQQLDRLAAQNPKAFWVRQIVMRIEDKKPREPQALKAPVVVAIHFVVARDGHLVDRRVTGTSGVAAIDDSAMATLDRAQPFPPMPAALTETEMAFDVPMRFR